MKRNGKYQAPTVKKAFEILRAIAERGEGMRISELSRDLGISKSTIHGVASALEDVGAITRNPSNKSYRLGLTLFELGSAAWSGEHLVDVARPVMERLRDKARESVFLGVRNGDFATILEVIPSRSDLKITAPVGTRIPLLAGAIGKIFLARMGLEKAGEYLKGLEIHRFTEKTVTDPEVYLREVQKVLCVGYAYDDEEYISGVRAVAAPIPGMSRQVSGIWVVGFKPGITDEKMRLIAEETRKAAEEIGGKIGKSGFRKGGDLE